jgi:ppGpp synthetase/RelA/SpoT-type nucleotidyltranferase
MVGERIQRLAGGRLRLLCSDSNWLFADRVKTAESALAKMQLGFMRDLVRMPDLYGATVVVATRDEIPAAVAAVRSIYPASEQRTRQVGDPAVFVYDDVHVHAALTVTAPGEPDEVRLRRFEIQIRTGLQYSWWRATHDRLYKGSAFDWRLERVAGQVRGSLEMLDGVLADLAAGASLLEPVERDIDTRRDRISACLEHWPDARRPSDVRAFCEAIEDLLASGRLSFEGLEHLLDSRRGGALIGDSGVTPAQAIAILVAEVRGVAALLKRGLQPGVPHRKRWILVTPEMERVSRLVKGVPSSRRSRV